MSLGGGEITQVTTAATGLSGITSTSPALSVAAQSGVAAFSVYGDGKYTINTLDAEEIARGRPIAGVRATAAVLPPIDRRPSEVAAALANPTLGTIATRVMHFGRYGTGGQDTRLFPLYIGYPDFVRGYDVGSFDGSDCIQTAASECPLFDRLEGSRMLVGNLELRFPLLRPFGASSRMYGPVPVEVALFADGGVAWNRGERPSIFGGARDGVSSAGLAIRVNLFGFAVGQFDFVRPFQRTTRDWLFQFNLFRGSDSSSD